MSDNNLPILNDSGTLLFYEGNAGKVRVEISYFNETFWLTQKKMAELFGVEVNTINYHLKEVFGSGELSPAATIRNFRIVRLEGNRQVTREIEHYTLDAVISVGYRVNSVQATQFRIWATQTLQEFIQKGFVLDDERLKLNTRLGPDYFDELLSRIREIRASERRFYQKITDLFEQAGIDYDIELQTLSILPPIPTSFSPPYDKTREGRARLGASTLTFGDAAHTVIDDIPAMPLNDAHFGGSFAFDFSLSPQRTGRLSVKKPFPSCIATDFGYTRLNNTRQGYARKRILKSAGYLFLGRDL